MSIIAGGSLLFWSAVVALFVVAEIVVAIVDSGLRPLGIAFLLSGMASIGFYVALHVLGAK